MKRCIFIISFALTLSAVQATGRYEFTPAIRTAYESVLDLRIVEAQTQLATIKKNDPNNYMVYFVENLADLVVIFISEEKATFDKLTINKDRRLEKLKDGDPTSPYHLFNQAQIKLHWAIARAKFGEYLTSFNEVKSAFDLLEKNQKKFPDFVPNKMTLGMMHALVGTIPDSYKWGVKLISGLNGTVPQGMREIEEVLNYAKTHDFEFHREALVVYAFLALHIKVDSDKSWSVINSGKLDPAKSPLAAFALANMAMRTGKNDEAIRILQKRPQGKNYFPFYFLDYQLGCAKLYRLDSDSDIHILKYIQNFHGKFYIKEAYQKLAWHALINGNLAAYKSNMELAKTKGTATIGADKNALKEAKSGIIPDVTLLKSRILYDGGYYQKAYDILSARTPSSFTQKSFQLEFYYRMGRITQGLKKTIEATYYFDKTIAIGRDEPYYYACNAALQLGIMYEKSGQKAKAKSAYELCLTMNPSDYADSLHAMAKAGLSRL